MRRHFLVLALLLATACNTLTETITDNSGEKPITTWEDPGLIDHCYLDGISNPLLSITKVEFYENETRLYAELRCNSWNKLRFPGMTCLKVENRKYRVRSIEGITLGKRFHVCECGKMDLVFHFHPLPADTERFSMHAGPFNQFFHIKEVVAPNIRYKNFFQSYWRNEKTGEWDIAFFNDRVIYDCRFWTYKEMPDIDNEVGEASFLVSDGDDEITIEVGAERNGKRTIIIDGEKEEYSMFNGQFIPDYPEKDYRDTFVDTDFSTVDTIEFSGWLRGWPNVFGQAPEVSMSCKDISSGKHEISFTTKVDEVGRFSLKIPVINTTTFYFSTDVFNIRTVLEPGQRYFMMFDFGEGRHLFMGKDARLQNELMKSGFGWHIPRMDHKDNDFDAYLAMTEKKVDEGMEILDNIMTGNPELSKRFYLYSKGEIMAAQASSLGQTVFNDNWKERAIINDYLFENYWKRPLKPYSLHREYGFFIFDFLLSFSRSDSMTINTKECLDQYVRSDEDRAVVDEVEAKFQAALKADEKAGAVDMERLSAIQSEFKKANKELTDRYDEILSKAVDQAFFQLGINRRLKILDSLGTEGSLKDVLMSQLFQSEFENKHRPLSQDMIDTLNKMIHNQIMIDRIIETNKLYAALEEKEFDVPSISTDNVDLSGLTEGQQLLEKILEPHRGRIVLLDVWGTWCSPCRERLSHSDEEYQALSDYDVVYIYLANNSPAQSWKNIIKEYNVIGDNVRHYNLPPEQQSSIERYLNIDSYPSYRLFDKKGKLVPGEIDVLDLERLKHHIKQVSK